MLNKLSVEPTLLEVTILALSNITYIETYNIISCNYKCFNP